MKLSTVLTAITSLFLSLDVSSQPADDACLLEALHNATEETTAAELRALCQPAQETLESTTVAPGVDDKAEPVEQRLQSQELSERNPFAVTAHDRNYLLPIAYNDRPNLDPWEELYPDSEIDSAEVKFQLSIKAQIAKGVLGGDLWTAYTQKSWWQLYNTDESSPFRETNYKPEVFLSWEGDWPLWLLDGRVITAGFVHESNGRSRPISRSWNRLFASIEAERGDFTVLATGWYRIPEDEEDDDNPDIVSVMGYGDVRAAWVWKDQVFSTTISNNLRSDNKGAVQLDWSFPLGSRFRGYVQYYNGYGESLIDYDVITERIGIGFMLNDWIQ